MKRLVWLVALLAASVGCGGTKPTPAADPSETKPTAPPPKGKQAALPE